MNTQVRRFCNAKTSLVSVFDFLANAMESQADRARLRSSVLRLPWVTKPSVTRADISSLWFGEPIVASMRFALGVWPFTFTVDEMTAASVFCSDSDNEVLSGPDRSKTLAGMGWIGGMLVNVHTVARIVENHDGTKMHFIVLRMEDGSHLCSCRTLQVLGLCCRHFWAAMRLSSKYQFHVGILNEHWLTERGRVPMSEWPEGSKAQWARALNHGPVAEAEDAGLEAPVASTGVQGGWWQAIVEDVTIKSSLVQLKEKGATPQDRRLLYLNCLKRATKAVGEGAETMHPDTLNQLVNQFVAGVRRGSRIESGAGVTVGNPDFVRLPASRSTGKRQRASHEGRSEAGAGARASSESYPF